jgi:hypothetical protein
MNVNLDSPKRKAIYCHLARDTKDSLDQLAKYHCTTLTNLIEQGAQMVVRSHLKQITQQNQTNKQLHGMNLDTSW